MKLDDANIFEGLAGFGDKNRELSSKEKLNRKFQYIEAVVRFLNLFCQNELGSGEADVAKVCMWINSPFFENTELCYYKTQEDIYKFLEEQLLHNVPLYRLLNISEHLLHILEENHTKELQEQMLAEAEKHPCLKCIWYLCEETSIGITSSCNKPKEPGLQPRKGYLDIYSVTECKDCTTLTSTPERIREMQKAYEDGKLNSGYYRNLTASLKAVDKLRFRWQKAFDTLDNSAIPKAFESYDLAVLWGAVKEAPLLDFARALGNKQGYAEIANNLQNAMLVKAMIAFIEIYAQSELGSDYIADVTAIARYVYEADGSIPKMSSEEDIYVWLEQQILNGNDMTGFCKNIYEKDGSCF